MATLEEVLAALNSATTDVREVLTKIPQIATTNGDVPFTFADGTQITLPGLPKLKSEVNNFIAGARREFVGTQLISSNWNNITTIALPADQGQIASCLLKHDTNATSNYRPTQSDLYDSNGNHLGTYPLHPAAFYKDAVFKTVKVHIENLNAGDTVPIRTQIVNKAPRTLCEKCFSHAGAYFYFTRDVHIEIQYMLTMEYPSSIDYFVDGEKIENSADVYIPQGWHYMETYARGGIISWNTFDLLRFTFTSSDSLQPLDILITHPSCLANVHLSAIVEKA